MTDRRAFLQAFATGLWTVGEAPPAPATRLRVAGAGGASPRSGETPMEKTGSDVGSLFPFIRSQATRSPSLSYLREEFLDLRSWKKTARGKLLELLHYAPERCPPRAEVVETVDRGEYVREKVYFNTTPDLRIPAYVL